MPKFSKYFKLNRTQHELDFVDVNNEQDTPVYVDPYAIQIRTDIWAERASETIRSFFLCLLQSLREEDLSIANELMSNFQEPKETFLGVSKGIPKGRGVGTAQAAQLTDAVKRSRAFKTGLLEDLSEMALYVEGIDRDKISDLTTNLIRDLLVEYTQQQCDLFGIPTTQYSSPPSWDTKNKNWQSRYVNLPRIDRYPVLLIPKYVVRRSLTINSQDFYNHQMTDFLVTENVRANSSLVKIVRKIPKVYKKDVRQQTPYSKDTIMSHCVV
jgi:hypothetical protein